MLLLIGALPACHQPNSSEINAGGNVTLTCNVQFSVPHYAVNTTPHISWNNDANALSTESAANDTSATSSITVLFNGILLPSYTCTITFTFESSLAGYDFRSNPVSASCSTAEMLVSNSTGK